MPKQSIKLLQRIGRTGRKRDGHVHVLMSEGREDLNWDTAQQTHRDIQEEILHSRNLELFEDVERLLPSKFPECVEKEMDIDPWDPAEHGRKMLPAASQNANASSKSKSNRKEKGLAKTKRVAEVPAGHEGFKSVAQLMKEGAMRRKKRGRDDSSEDDEEEETLDDPPAFPDDNEEDESLLCGGVSSSRIDTKPKKAVARSQGSKKAKSSPRSSARSREDEKAREVEEFERRREDLNRRALDFFNTQGLVRDLTPSPIKSPIHATPPSSPHDYTLGDYNANSNSKGNSKLSPRTAEMAGFSQIDLSVDMSSDDDRHNELVKATISRSPRSAPSRSAPRLSDMAPPPVPLSPMRPSIVHETPLPRQSGQRLPSTGGTEPTPFPVRRGGRNVRVPPSSDQDSPASRPLQRLRRRAATSSPAGVDTSPIVERRRKRPNPHVDQYLDMEVGVSGSESSDEGSGEENESDRLFAGDFQATQAPRGYDQHAVYAAGLSTQVAGRAGLAFRSRDRAPAFLAKARQPVLLSDDERSSDNEYELGSFVCDDDEDVGFECKSHPQLWS